MGNETDIHCTLTCSAKLSVWIPSSAMTENTQVFPVPDFACTIRSEKEI